MCEEGESRARSPALALVVVDSANETAELARGLSLARGTLRAAADPGVTCYEAVRGLRHARPLRDWFAQHACAARGLHRTVEGGTRDKRPSGNRYSLAVIHGPIKRRPAVAWIGNRGGGGALFSAHVQPRKFGADGLGWKVVEIAVRKSGSDRC